MNKDRIVRGLFIMFITAVSVSLLYNKMYDLVVYAQSMLFGLGLSNIIYEFSKPNIFKAKKDDETEDNVR